MSADYYQEKGAVARDTADTNITEYITKTIEKYNEETLGWEVIGQINGPHENPWAVPHIDTTQPGVRYRIRYNVKDEENRPAEEVVRLINIRQQVLGGQMRALDGIVYRYVGKWQSLEGTITTTDQTIDFLLAWHGRVLSQRNTQGYFTRTDFGRNLFTNRPINSPENIVLLAGSFDENTKEFAMFQHNHFTFDNIPNYINGYAMFAPYGSGETLTIDASGTEGYGILEGGMNHFDTTEEYWDFINSNTVFVYNETLPPKLLFSFGIFFNYMGYGGMPTHAGTIAMNTEYGETPRGTNMPCIAQMGAVLKEGGSHATAYAADYIYSQAVEGKLSYIYEITDGNFDITLTDTGYEDYLTGGNITNLSNIETWNAETSIANMWKPRVFERDLLGNPILPNYADYNDPDHMVYNDSPTKLAHPTHPLRNWASPAYLSPDADFGYDTVSGPTVLADQINLAGPLDEVFNMTN